MFSLRCHQLVRSLYNIQNTLTLKEVSLSPSGPCNERAISTSGKLLVDYYEALGVPPKSTQSEIKAAYYKLSMIYHPDKNQGSDSAQKFREITQAYEVLSNYRLRRLYDKGIIHTAGSHYAQTNNVRPDVEDVEDDDPQTKFYKSRFTKSKVANPQGQNPIYNFDEWSRAHYGNSLNRKKSAQERYDRKQATKKEDINSFQKETVIYGLVIGTILVFIVGNMEASYDNPRTKGKEK